MKRWAILLILFLLAVICTGQDPQFSRFYSNALYMAPSFAGSAGQNRISGSYRTQWPEINTAFISYTLAFDHYFEKLRSGVGVLFLNDIAGSGELTTTNIGALYNYDFRIGHTLHVRPGMHFMYTQRKIDFNKLIWRDQMSAAGNALVTGEVVSYDKVGDIDFAVSGLVFNETFWIGTSVDHLLRPSQSLYSQEFADDNLAHVPIKTQVFGGWYFVLKEQLLRPTPTVLQVAFLYKNQEDFNQLDLGIYYNYEPIVLGVWYRGVPIVKNNKMNDALIFLVGYKTKQFNIGYSYDFTTSKLVTSSGGAHEISLAYSFKQPEIKRKHKKMIPCPDF